MDSPLGEFPLVVTRDGEISKEHVVRVVRSNFGIFTTNGAGWGPARFGSASQITFRNPARPGNPVTIAGTGLGEDARVELFVAGRPAPVLKVNRGPEGIDEITFRVPQNAPEGCFVPIYAASVKSSAHPRWVSNPATIPIARKGFCKPPSHWPISPVLTGQTVGTLLFTRQIELPSDGAASSESITDRGFATFFTAAGRQPVVSPIQLMPPPGSCIFSAGFFDAETLTSGLFLLASSNLGNVEPADAGPFLRLVRPGIERIFQPRPGAVGVYSGLLGNTETSRRALALFLEPGKFSVSAEGGRSIGAFSIDLSAPAGFTWSNWRSIQIVDRSRGLHLEWKPLLAGQRMLVFAIGVDRVSRNAGTCVCLAPEGVARFFVPPDVFAGFPSVGVGPETLPAYLGLAVIGPSPLMFRADGMDEAVAATLVLQAKRIQFR
jgi:hypothetical protein